MQAPPACHVPSRALTRDTSSAKPGMVSRVSRAKKMEPQKNVIRRAFVSRMDALKGGPCMRPCSRAQNCYASQHLESIKLEQSEFEACFRPESANTQPTA